MPYYDEDEPRPVETEDEKILREARDRYRNWVEKWAEARTERGKDMRYILGDPWKPEDRDAREKEGRPCINHDELNQYVAGAIGNLRAAKRGIKVEPGGNGASDQTAEFRQNLIRGIEYKSQAQGAYMNAYQAMLEGSYGFIRISRDYCCQDEDGPDDQQICIEAIQNPDSVVYDPDCKKSDWSDPRAVFVLDPIPFDEFKRLYPHAKKQDFGEDDRRVASGWIGEKTITVAEYWRVEVTRVMNRRGTREVEKRKVVQYMLNGVEVIERNPQPGGHIPVVPFFGIERWVDDGGSPVRKINSMIRMARDPQLSLAYLSSQQLEEAGLTPKAPYLGYVGQFETDKDAWDTVTRRPHAYLQVDPLPDTGGGQALPLPQRVPFTPNTQAYEVAKDSCRRAIQAAMGITALPTAAQRNNEKSGVALERIQQQQAIGTLTFVDKFEAGLAYAGRIINSWIPVTYDTDREVAIRLPDDTHKVVKIGARPALDMTTEDGKTYSVGEGEHDVTIGTGPSDASQREAASDFLDVLIANLGNLPVAPPQAAKLLSLAIQMKQLGPKGDEMADIISPAEKEGGPQIPPEILQAVEGLKQQMAALNAYAQSKEKEVQELQQKIDAKVIDNEYRERIERMKIEADITKAEIATKAQSIEERVAFVEDMMRQFQVQRHEQEQKDAERQHAAMMTAAEQQHAMELQQSQQAAAAEQAQQAAAAQQAEQAAAQQAQQPI
jgi:hypothetical protein